MNLQHATLEQLLDWQWALVEELARRASSPAAPSLPLAPWEQAAPQQSQHAQPPEPPRYRPQHEPRRRPAIGAGMNGRNEPVDSLQTSVGPQYTPAKRPPGTVYETGATDPDLAAAFHKVPVRADGLPPINGNGAGQGAFNLEPG